MTSFAVRPYFIGCISSQNFSGRACHDITGGAVLFVVMASIFHGLLTPWLAPKFPKFFKHGYEPLFFNASLSFAEKLEKWRVQPRHRCNW